MSFAAPTADYADFLAKFKVEDLDSLLAGDPNHGLNLCHECCDRWAGGDRIALYWASEDGTQSSHTFAELRESSARFANFLASQGIGRGDRVACMLPRIPELLVVALGVWRAGAVYVPLFTAFGSGAVEYRLQVSEARLVVTDTKNRAKLDPISSRPPVVTLTRQAKAREGDIDFHEAMRAQPGGFEPVTIGAEDPFLLMFTSGTVGKPKALTVPARGLVSLLCYLKFAVDVRPDDRYWNMADPGWAYGLYYAVTAALALGGPTHFYDGAFSVESAYRQMAAWGITNLGAAPTAYRMLMAAGEGPVPKGDLKLRLVASAGEPLNPEVIRWIERIWGCPVFDHYGQTETGMTVCNHAALRHKIRPGSMGRAVPGFAPAVLNERFEPVAPGDNGQLAIDIAHSPLFHFQGYYQQEQQPIHEGYYLTGDVVAQDPDGTYTFVGRNDDVITSAGYRIGPFDVESCLIEHPAVAESAVVGKPDAERGSIVQAFVVLKGAAEQSGDLTVELQRWVRERLSAHAYPREIVFVDALPKTPSGKVKRYLLRQQRLE